MTAQYHDGERRCLPSATHCTGLRRIVPESIRSSMWTDRSYKTDLRDLIEIQAQRFAQVRAELIEWMFLFWLGTVAAAIFTR